MLDNILAMNMLILFRVLITELVMSTAEDKSDSKQLVEIAQKLIKNLYEERYYCFCDTDIEHILQRYHLLFDGICSIIKDMPEEN